MERAFPADRFSERFGAIPVAPANLIFKTFNHGVHVREEAAFNPDLAVELWMDPGYSGSHYAIEALQFPGSGKALGDSGKQEAWVVDELYGELATAQEMIVACKDRPWWGKVKTGVIDIAGRQHAAMPSQVEVWASAGIGLRSQQVGVRDGIDRHQTFLKDPANGQPRLFINPKCSGLIAEYARWRRKEVTLDRVAISEPEKTNCDALKALSYGLIDHFGPIERAPVAKSVRRAYLQ